MTSRSELRGREFLSGRQETGGLHRSCRRRRATSSPLGWRDPRGMTQVSSCGLLSPEFVPDACTASINTSLLQFINDALKSINLGERLLDGGGSESDGSIKRGIEEVKAA